MMNSYQQNRGRNKSRYIFAAVLVAFVFLVDGLAGGNIRALLREAASNVWGMGSAMSESILGSGVFSTRRALLRENQALRDEMSQLEARAAAFGVLREENEALRKLVYLTEEDRGITAPIVSSFHSSPYGTFLIRAGEEDGIAEGHVVIVGDAGTGGFVAGRVADTGARTSLVKSIFASGEKIDAVISGVGVSVEGRGGGQARAEAPREALIEAGDIAVSGDLGGRPIGVVGNVEKEAEAASQHVYIHLPVNLYETRFVYVLPAQQ